MRKAILDWIFPNGIVANMLLLPLIFTSASCSRDIETDQRSTNISAAGKVSDNAGISVTLEADDNTVVGFGQVNGRSFSLSGVLSLQGPVTLSFSDGDRIPGHLSLPVNSSDVSLTVQGEQLILETDPSANGLIAVGQGRFNGSFRSADALSLALRTEGKLLSGSGVFLGKPIGLVATETETGAANGLLLFADGTQIAIELKQNADASPIRLTVSAGGVYVLERS